MAIWSAEARRFLERHRVGHLATSGADGAPHVVPLCYAVDDSALYFVADEKPKRRPARTLRRLDNIRENPRAAVVVDDYDDDWRRLAYLLVRGPARILADAAEHAAALRLLRARYPQYAAMSLEDPIAHPIVRLDPARVVLWRASS
jgi:PPOX class probable F420-dependent enzyme